MNESKKWPFVLKKVDLTWTAFPSVPLQVSVGEDWSFDSRFTSHRQHHQSGNQQMLEQAALHFHLPNATDLLRRFTQTLYITQVSHTHFIKSGRKCFQPAEGSRAFRLFSSTTQTNPDLLKQPQKNILNELIIPSLRCRRDVPHPSLLGFWFCCCAASCAGHASTVREGSDGVLPEQPQPSCGGQRSHYGRPLLAAERHLAGAVLVVFGWVSAS